MNENAEQDWVERAKQGEPGAISELYRRYWRAGRAAAYGVTGDLALAEDAACEGFYAAMEGLEGLRDTQKFGPWLRTIVVRTAKRMQRDKYKKVGERTGKPADTDTVEPGGRLEQRELAALIHEAVGNLSESLREAISLFYFEGYSVEEAGRFLDVPAGTVKRRLHDGRGRLRKAAEQILKGRKPVNQEREQVLQQLKELIDKGRDSVDSVKVFREVLRLRPLPYELMGKFLGRHSNTAKKMATPKGREEVERRSRKVMELISRPSERALDPDHAVGKVAHAIRAALPEFKEWPVDVSHAARSLVQRLSGNFDFLNLPPGFAEGYPGSYMYAARGGLFQGRDGSMRTMYEVVESKDTKDLNDELFIRNGRLSDTLVLMWMRSDTIELREVEKLLRGLCAAVVPQVEERFLAYEEPRYRSALRMEFGDIPIPAATGGPLNAWPNMCEGVSAACVVIYLEAWARAQSGEVVELTALSGLLDLVRDKTDQINQ